MAKSNPKRRKPIVPAGTIQSLGLIKSGKLLSSDAKQIGKTNSWVGLYTSLGKGKSFPSRPRKFPPRQKLPGFPGPRYPGPKKPLPHYPGYERRNPGQGAKPLPHYPGRKKDASKAFPLPHYPGMPPPHRNKIKPKWTGPPVITKGVAQGYDGLGVDELEKRLAQHNALRDIAMSTHKKEEASYDESIKLIGQHGHHMDTKQYSDIKKGAYKSKNKSKAALQQAAKWSDKEDKFNIYNKNKAANKK
tara:strand:+ start:474 stop:1211 length:738 start_codon:yes stop_codon:yes gene_type:complete